MRLKLKKSNNLKLKASLPVLGVALLIAFQNCSFVDTSKMNDETQVSSSASGVTPQAAAMKTEKR